MLKRRFGVRARAASEKQLSPVLAALINQRRSCACLSLLLHLSSVITSGHDCSINGEATHLSSFLLVCGPVTSGFNQRRTSHLSSFLLVSGPVTSGFNQRLRAQILLFLLVTVR